MKKIEISYLNYDDICQLVRDDYKWVDKDTLIKQFIYLKNKFVAEPNRRIENPSIAFLFTAVESTRFAPDYPKAVKGFIESTEVSNTIKEYIFNMLKETDTDVELLTLLQSEASFNEFTKEQIAGIKQALDHLFTTKGVSGEENYQVHDMLNDYVFSLNGEGPVSYIKGLYTEEELANEFLTHSGMKADTSFYARRGMQRIDLNENHLLSIYRKFDKFMPEKRTELYNLIKQTPLLDAADFVANYFKFIRNGFNSQIEYSFSRKPLDYRGLSRIQIEDEELYRYNQQKIHELTVSRFFGQVVKYERDKALGNHERQVLFL